MRTDVSAAAACLLWAAMSPTPAEAASCTVAAQGVNFGSYDQFAPYDLDGIGNIRVECDAATAVEISLGAGSDGYAVRRMTAGSDELLYNLYTNVMRTTVWGDGTGGSGTVSTNALSADLTVYGSVPSRQNPRPGVFADTVIVTITY